VSTAPDSDLAAGGTLASGGFGIYDASPGTKASLRKYDNFAGYVPVGDAVVFGFQKAQLTAEGMYRLDSGGTAYGPVSRVIGDLPRIPITKGGRTTEAFIKGKPGRL
jgi:hypothetical protein